MKILKSVAVLFLIVVLAACNFNKFAKAAIDSANNFQDAAAHAFNDAKDTVSAEAKACGAKAKELGVTPSFSVCKEIGTPLSYDPEKLNKLAGPINASYDAIRGANDVRLAVLAGTGDKAQFFVSGALIIKAFDEFVTAAKEANVKIDEKKLAEVNTAFGKVQ